MVILGIDPGLHTSGTVVYDSELRKVLHACDDTPNSAVFEHIYTAVTGRWSVVIEKPAGMGRLSVQQAADLIETAWIAGEFHRAAIDASLTTVALTRREVRRRLGVLSTPGNTDTVVGRAVMADHGGDKSKAMGTKANPGPLYGITRQAGHAMQALAAVLAHLEDQ